MLNIYYKKDHVFIYIVVIYLIMLLCMLFLHFYFFKGGTSISYIYNYHDCSYRKNVFKLYVNMSIGKVR